MSAVELVKRAKSIYEERGLRSLLGRSLQYAFEDVVPVLYRIGHSYDPSCGLPAVIEVSPDEIQRTRFSKRQFPTSDAMVEDDVPHDEPIVGVLDGPWDRYRREWSESRFHREMCQRYVDGDPWEEIDLYRRNLRKVRNGETGQHHVSTVEEVEQRFEDVDRLYESMREEGYVPQAELLERGDGELSTESPSVRYIVGEPFPDECRVGIGRDGSIVRFSGGRHRVSIAKILDVDSIPVVVVVRHAKWQKIREAFEQADGIEDVPDRYRRFADHPDVPTEPDADRSGSDQRIDLESSRVAQD